MLTAPGESGRMGFRTGVQFPSPPPIEFTKLAISAGFVFFILGKKKWCFNVPKCLFVLTNWEKWLLEVSLKWTRCVQSFFC